MTQKYKQVINEIRHGNSFLVASHVNPEGDAVGSLLSLTLGLKGLQKDVTAYLYDPVPKTFKFLPFADKVVNKIDENKIYDAVLVVDCGQKDRLGEDFGKIKNRGKLINIDHHATNDRFGDINVIDADACASGEMVYDLLKEMPVSITRDMAINIYTSILTDTGSFRYSCATPKAFGIAGEMLKLGANPWDISQRVYESNPVNKLKLLASVLDTLELTNDGKVASLVVTLDMLNKANATKEEADGFVNYARTIEGVEVGVLLREAKPGEYKISFRSRGRIDVAEISQEFGGGGHMNAAGCNIKGNLKDIKEKVISATEKRIHGTVSI
ncbi:MAG: bifunctional oligoribonuclease/PAP phosphatase NrnA [Deltaproteobacteria bacterium]|nr:bifunctional oligoribonuclease/PAP phosphatase NrnA [Deltaproteobacteria bacterium]